MSSDDHSNLQRYRVRVFVDFWNYTLSMRQVDTDFRTDWSTLGPVLSRAATALATATGTGEYQGLNSYGSYDPDRDEDRKLLRWATTTVNSFPGVSVSIVPSQQKRSPPSCPARTAQRGDQAPHPSVCIFPNPASCLRLIRTLCTETHEGWLEDHRHLNMEYLKEQKMDLLETAA